MKGMITYEYEGKPYFDFNGLLVGGERVCMKIWEEKDGYHLGYYCSGNYGMEREYVFSSLEDALRMLGQKAW